MRELNRYMQTLWDNLGGLLGGNFLTFLGFLPLALGLSLGLVYENIWIVLLSGLIGGALAGVFWAAMLSLALQAFKGGTRGWFTRWRKGAGQFPALSAGVGACLGLLCGGLGLVGNFANQLLGGGNVPLSVWLLLSIDFFLLSLAAALLFPVLCMSRIKPELKGLLSVLLSAPGKVCAAGGATLLWCGLGTALFPVSVPFALVVGFWPLALFTAQVMLPVLEENFLVEFEPVEVSPGVTARRRSEIFWRRRWPVVVIVTAVTGLLLWGGSQLFTRREPDIQIAVVHAQSLPDSVRETLEQSLAQLVGDRNGDGQALALVNDYTVVFDGSAVSPDMQTAGTTLLVSDVAAGASALYLTEDPEGFLSRYGDQVDEARAVRWEDCPALAGLDAGMYSVLEDISADLSGQSLLAPLTVLPGGTADQSLLELMIEPS